MAEFDTLSLNDQLNPNVFDTLLEQDIQQSQTIFKQGDSIAKHLIQFLDSSDLANIDPYYYSNTYNDLVSVIGSELKLSTLDDNVLLTDSLNTLLLFDTNELNRFFNHVFERFARTYAIGMGTQSNDTEFLLEHLMKGTLEHFLDRYFEKNEGSAFSHDKTVHVLNRLKQHIILKDPQPLYSEHDFGKGLVKAYWTPETVETTEQAIKLFHDWYFLV